MLSKFLDPKNDVAFKKIFGTPKNQDILIHFLNDMLLFKSKNPITAVTFLKSIQDPEIAAKKTSIVDIMCTDQEGNKYIVEMQVAEGTGFVKRAQYYAAKAYSSQLKVGEKYHNLKEIIFLAITNFIMFPDKKEFKSDHIILDQHTKDHDLKDFSFTFLELGKFNKTKEELNSIIDRWSYFFKHAIDTSEKDLNQIIGEDLIIKRAYEELDKFGWSEEELFAYEEIIKRETDYQATLAKQYTEGRTEGRAEGIIEGEIKGVAKGKIEEAKNIAKAMLEESLDLNLISRLTNLPIEEIKKL